MSIAVFQDSIEQIWNKGDSSAIERFIAPNYIGVDPAAHTGEFGGIPPTGRRVRVTAIAIAKITRGKIVVEHANSDALGLLTQLGVIEAPPQGSRPAVLTQPPPDRGPHPIRGLQCPNSPRTPLAETSNARARGEPGVR